jgi:hypothetical protein
MAGNNCRPYDVQNYKKATDGGACAAFFRSYRERERQNVFEGRENRKKSTPMSKHQFTLLTII